MIKEGENLLEILVIEKSVKVAAMLILTKVFRKKMKKMFFFLNTKTNISENYGHKTFFYI